MDMDKSQGKLSSVLILVLVLLFVLAVSACSTAVPVTVKFPDPPGQAAMTVCPQLEKLPDTPALSDISRTVSNNYSTYYQCAVKTDAWIEWYSIQWPVHPHHTTTLQAFHVPQ